MMNWINCISAKRTGYDYPSSPSIRSDYQRDYDRLIFSSAFRRLQNKTQVFPLPGSSTFVHNRLTHSLEVASVGRSIGSILGEYISELLDDDAAKYFYKHDLKAVIGAGCLAHDVGNPAFGHSGEKAISNYFINNQNTIIGNSTLISYFNDSQWADLIDFEGNANALRVLTHHFTGKMPGGLSLTYSTLASILKYPCESLAKTKAKKHRKKYGFFQSEKEIFSKIVKDTNMYFEQDNPLSYYRHPFVYMVEAADDICYRIIDMEDAHRLKILSKQEVEHAFLSVIQEVDRPEIDMDKIKQTLIKLHDDNESITYLRAKCINAIVLESADVFKLNAEKIITGKYESTLMDDVEKKCPSLKMIESLSINKIYDHPSVIKVELAGYKVMSGLFDIFVRAILNEEKSIIEKKSLKLIPNQFIATAGDTPYNNVMSVIDFISGMTDDYAVQMYRNIMGIDIANHNI
ncbi:MAG: dNTP triphosphohydrolase [Saprospiraceae bacterium]